MAEISPDYPSALRGVMAPDFMDIYVYVSLDEQGHPVKIGVLNSSGFDAADRAVEHAASQSTYAPAQEHCVPVPGVFVYHGEFASPSAEVPENVVLPVPLPHGWTNEPAGLSFADGRRVGAWHDGSADFAVSAVRDDGNTPISDYLLKLWPRQSAPPTTVDKVCNGTLDAATMQFGFAFSDVAKRSFILRAVRSGRIVYTFTYSVEKGELLDPSVLAVLNAYCPPDHLRGLWQ